MYNTIKRLYAKTGDGTVVENAVKKGWITREQADEILGKNKKVEEVAESTMDEPEITKE